MTWLYPSLLKSIQGGWISSLNSQGFLYLNSSASWPEEEKYPSPCKPRSDVDSSVVTWGDTEWGGDSSKVQQRLKKGATQAWLQLLCTWADWIPADAAKVFGTFGAFDVSEDTWEERASS